MTEKQSNSIFNWFCDCIVKGAEQLKALDQMPPEVRDPARRRHEEHVKGFLRQMTIINRKKTLAWVAEQSADIQTLHEYVTTFGTSKDEPTVPSPTLDIPYPTTAERRQSGAPKTCAPIAAAD